MNFRENFVNSLIKGLGKTTGTLLMLGVASGMWYLATSQKRLKHLKTKKTNKNTNNTQELEPHTTDENFTLKTMKEIESIDEIESIPFEDTDKFKKMFDKI